MCIGRGVLAATPAYDDDYGGNVSGALQIKEKSRGEQRISVAAFLPPPSVVLLKSKKDPAQMSWKDIHCLPLLWPAARAASIGAGGPGKGLCPNRLIHRFHWVQHRLGGQITRQPRKLTLCLSV